MVTSSTAEKLKMSVKEEQKTFELSGSMTKEIIENLFRDEIISIEINGKKLSVINTLAVSGESLVTELLKAKCKLDYFRDISSSTTKMFS